MNIYLMFASIICVVSFSIFENEDPVISHPTTQNSVIATSKNSKISHTRLNNMTIRASLLPYEILAEEATSYADLTLALSNTLPKSIDISINRIEVLNLESQQVLIDSTFQDFELPVSFKLKTKETKILEYRLQRKSQVYQRHQDVFAKIYYQENGKTEQFTKSNIEAVAFMIP